MEVTVVVSRSAICTRQTLAFECLAQGFSNDA
jgi:hypothetical protein